VSRPRRTRRARASARLRAPHARVSSGPAVGSSGARHRLPAARVPNKPPAGRRAQTERHPACRGRCSAAGTCAETASGPPHPTRPQREPEHADCPNQLHGRRGRSPGARAPLAAHFAPRAAPAPPCSRRALACTAALTMSFFLRARAARSAARPASGRPVPRVAALSGRPRSQGGSRGGHAARCTHASNRGCGQALCELCRPCRQQQGAPRRAGGWPRARTGAHSRTCAGCCPSARSSQSWSSLRGPRGSAAR